MRLISNPIHTPNHELEEIEIIVPIKIIDTNKVFERFFII